MARRKAKLKTGTKRGKGGSVVLKKGFSWVKNGRGRTKKARG